MTTKTATKKPSLDEIEAQAQQLREQAQSLRAEQEAAERAERDRVAEATHDFVMSRRRNYVRDFGGKIRAARDAFEQAVAEGGDALAAWATYRQTTAVTVAEWRANELHVQRRESEKYDAIMADLRSLTEEGARLDTWPREDRGGAEYRQRLAEWNRRRADFEGITEPCAPRAIKWPEGLSDPRSRSLGGPNVAECSRHRGSFQLSCPGCVQTETFAEAYEHAVRRAERDAVDRWQAERDAARDAHVQGR